MSMNIKTPGVHHIALRSSDLARSKRFYTETLGFSIVAEVPNLFLFMAGGTAFGVRGPEAETAAGDQFNPFRIGLDHIALGCEDEGELERVAAALQQAGVENTGVKLDETLGKKYVAFKDPDRISWEYYMV
jgi:catechol 2,3-dioxygenase-like lactoylglutathione lyase family enzyme